MKQPTTDNRPITERILEASHEHGCAVALSQQNRQLTYQELESKARQFASYLAQVGVNPGGVVAICLERSFDSIIAALGIMCAGAAYVPLDPTWPDSRLRFAVKDSGATVLVARAEQLERLEIKIRGVDPGRQAAIIAATREGSCRTIDPSSLAYIIYTSGSTGVPKGVEISHKNLSHLVRWHLDTFHVTKDDRASHLAGLGFDAAVWEVWPHLSAGASIILADESVRSSPELLQQWLVKENVTIAFVPTIHAKPLIAMKWPSSSLRLMLTGGDVLNCGPTVQLPFDVVNNYGPTECTVVSTSTMVKSNSHSTPAIGSPIAGTRVYLLDEQGKHVPDETPAEIYIGGGGVGRGYRNLPESTERSFLEDPFSEIPGTLMYRTGDLAIRRADGQLEFRGRMDRQTKIRGHRVELDEIASILSQHPNLAFATVIAKVSEENEKQLIAYVLIKPDSLVPTIEGLQAFLLNCLPDYMIPAAFLRLSAVPLSPSGKIDFGALESLKEGSLVAAEARRCPADLVEGKLLSVVREILKNDAVGLKDNFFLAGGHSLLGMRLLMTLREEFKVDLTLSQLFEAPTVEHLSVLISNLLTEKHPQDAGSAMGTATDESALPSGVFALRPDGNRRAIFWVHYLNGNLAKYLGDNQPFISVRLVPEDLAQLGEVPALQEIAACLVQKILLTQPEGPYNIGGFCLGGVLAYEIASQMLRAGREVSLLVLLDAPNPSYFKSHRPLAPRLSEPRYLLKRMARVGLRKGFSTFRSRAMQSFGRLVDSERSKTEVNRAQETIERAALNYQPKKYEGRVLLVLAGDRPPHVDFLPGWQAVVADHLRTRYVDTYHTEMMNLDNAKYVADIIISNLGSTSGEDIEAPPIDMLQPAAGKVEVGRI